MQYCTSQANVLQRTSAPSGIAHRADIGCGAKGASTRGWETKLAHCAQGNDGNGRGRRHEGTSSARTHATDQQKERAKELDIARQDQVICIGKRHSANSTRKASHDVRALSTGVFGRTLLQHAPSLLHFVSYDEGGEEQRSACEWHP